jgi:carboxyl-terminal processing protease
MPASQYKLKQIIIAIVLFVIIITAAFMSGVYFQAKNQDNFSLDQITNKDPNLITFTDFGPFWKTWQILQEKHVSSGSTTTLVKDQDKIWGAIEGLAASYGDPYTEFFPPAEAQAFDEDIRGNFGGVGMEVAIKDEILTVVAPLKGTPAEKAGVLSGDKILQIDETITAGLNSEEAVRLIRGEAGTKVKIVVFREGATEPKDITITRGIINVPTINNFLRGDGVYVIELYNFSADSANSFRVALREFIASGSRKLVLDLRGNPGGYLEAAIDMASWFLPSGEVVVKEEFKEGGELKVYRSKGYNVFNEKLTMVVLIDGGSASASEILAGALQEHGIAQLIGTNSFGKGSVQELVKITPDTSLKVTIAKWFTPNGVSISEGGLKPDIEVKRTAEEYLKDIDPQMQKAVEILLQK